ncbi:pentapeptide repeat-containing protein [Paenibacillus barcinonensis]|uniref:Pentapeptide repeat-containing protein n=1 Tax=Paenibacillus barcinonensis TaxID=198119 RepID=A0A2V4W5P5_PAEBA|nr:pentapeptide repeat-containing protein [Paenibacillus barcinonensis]PYE50157.1 uncharacterized protein YjbI with pentapeptide repeats [Paenibacillus barcinonensis]QKS54861.1 pentapeptide repeat-containing protein [Paenibacillus barcinonensis]
MSEITKFRKFIDNQSLTREKEDLTYTVFEKLNFIDELPQISFFRSDFRGSKFVEVQFYKNNFDRADFISAVFDSCLFKEVNIAASEIKNCYFNNCEFSLNDYANTSIQECTFENCNFENEQFLVNMKNCKFINCTLHKCQFERSTTEKMDFNHCHISESNMATMHAENYSFSFCKLENVSFGISYIFGYLFHETDISGLDVLYRGNSVKMNIENFSEYIISLLSHQRFYEFINANIFLFKKFDEIPDHFSHALIELSKINNSTRKLQITYILDMISFYTLNNQLPYKFICEILKRLDQFDWSIFPFDEQLVYMSLHKKIEMIITNFQYDYSFIESSANSTLFLTFTCKTDEYQEAFEITSNMLDELHSKLGFPKKYNLILKEKGSWILTFVVASTVGLMLPKLFNDYSNIYFNFVLKNRLLKKAELLLDNVTVNTENISTVIETLQLSSDLFSKAGLTNQKLDTLTASEAFKKIVSRVDINV